MSFHWTNSVGTSGWHISIYACMNHATDGICTHELNACLVAHIYSTWEHTAAHTNKSNIKQIHTLDSILAKCERGARRRGNSNTLEVAAATSAAVVVVVAVVAVKWMEFFICRVSLRQNVFSSVVYTCIGRVLFGCSHLVFIIVAISIMSSNKYRSNHRDDEDQANSNLLLSHP